MKFKKTKFLKTKLIFNFSKNSQDDYIIFNGSFFEISNPQSRSCSHRIFILLDTCIIKYHIFIQFHLQGIASTVIHKQSKIESFMSQLGGMPQFSYSTI